VARAGGLLYGSIGKPVRLESGKEWRHGIRAGRSVFALDVETGKPRWVYHGKQIMLMTVCIGDGRLFLVDREVTEPQREQALQGVTHKPRLDRLGEPMGPDVRLVIALDAQTGRKLWERPQYVSDCVKVGKSGGDLTMMYAKNVLVLCGQPWNGHFWREFLAGEFSRRSLIALAGSDGRPLWSARKGYRSRPLIVGDQIVAEPWACDLRTGADIQRAHPVTGAMTKWQMSRPGHHCGNIAAGPHALFFRSDVTAYYDLIGDYGTAHFGAQRPGCWINCIPANGLVLMPEASSGCVCPYSLMCTVVLQPRKVNRVWGQFSAAGSLTPVKHLALNFGAPGDRKDAKGTLWLAYPRPGGSLNRQRLVLGLDIAAQLYDGGEFFCRNADFLTVGGAEVPWIYASGCTGLWRCRIPVAEKDKPGREYTVRLHFAEPRKHPPGRRVFSVSLQGKRALKDFDIVKEAGGPDRAVVKEFKGVRAGKELKLQLAPNDGQAAPAGLPIISAIEVIAEGP